MRFRPLLALSPALALIAACSSNDVTVDTGSSDAGDTEASWLDIATDSPPDSHPADASPDSHPDSSLDSPADSPSDATPDSSVDSSASDSASDSKSDSTVDSSTADSSSDSLVDSAPIDSAPDSLVDSSTSDSSVDSASTDSASDSSFDASAFSSGAWSQSSYLSLPSDLTPSDDSDLLTSSFDLPAASWVLLTSDGRYGPAGGTAASVYISIDGGKISNDSYIDWSSSTNPQQHCFNVIGAVWLSSGHHVARLRADTINGSFFVGAGSNLSVMIHPSDQLVAKSSLQDSQAFNYLTSGDNPGIATPHDPLLSASANLSSASDVVALASARVYHGGSGSGTYGDAMLGIYLDGSNPGNGQSTWSVNDIWTGAETQAPLFAHAFFASMPSGNHTVSFDTSEFPWTGQEDTVVYTVGAGATFLVLRDGLTVRGSAPISQALNNSIDYIGIGTNENWPGVPAVSTDVELASSTFVVPPGHSGVVMFMAKSRVQGDSADAGGTVSLRLSLDGSFVGSTGIQQLKSPDSVSQRTISSSYLASGSLALTPGSHTIKAIARAEGSFKHLAMNKDLPLLWFD